jgi:hypothetical protein
MARSDKSKTNVTARAQLKGQKVLCRFCGNEIEAVMRLRATGGKGMVRLCCEKSAPRAAATA